MQIGAGFSADSPGEGSVQNIFSRLASECRCRCLGSTGNHCFASWTFKVLQLTSRAVGGLLLSAQSSFGVRGAVFGSGANFLCCHG